MYFEPSSIPSIPSCFAFSKTFSLSTQARPFSTPSFIGGNKIPRYRLACQDNCKVFYATAVLPRRNKPKPVLRFWLIPFSIMGLVDAACSVSYRMLMRDVRLASPLLAENVPYFLPIRKKFLFCCAKPEKRLIKRDYSAGHSFSQPVLTDKEAGQPDDSLLPDNTFRQYHRSRSETGLFPSMKSDPDCSKTVCGTAVSPSEENAPPAQCPSCR